MESANKRIKKSIPTEKYLNYLSDFLFGPGLLSIAKSSFFFPWPFFICPLFDAKQWGLGLTIQSDNLAQEGKFRQLIAREVRGEATPIGGGQLLGDSSLQAQARGLLNGLLVFCGLSDPRFNL